MLVLSRKAGESVKVADNIEIVVVSVYGQRVRLGIKAPKDVRIMRAEFDPSTINANKNAAIKGDTKQSDLLKTAAKAAASQTK
ncbi:MAG: carbon storage regulator CsrA [Verrucomicrobiota bacterium]